MRQLGLPRLLIGVAALVVWFGLVGLRIARESTHLVRSRFTGSVVGSSWDPRGQPRLDRIARLRESESFRERLRGAGEWRWPGLEALQVALSWLEILQGLHNEASYEGDFSWIFSKLHRVIEGTPRNEIGFVATLAPFYFVIGHDYAGANVVMDAMIRRAPGSWPVWFWSGYHALDNLHSRSFASDLYGRAALLPGSPFYLAALSARLSLGADIPKSQIGEALEKSLDPHLLELVKKARPEYFPASPE